MSNVEEKYARAISTSHLKLGRLDEAPGDAETIIAAGMAEPLGVLLARLKTEWDTISAHEVAQAANSLTARVLILMGLRSLAPAKQAMLRFALCKAASYSCDPSTKPRDELGAMTARLGEELEDETRAVLVAAHRAKAVEVAKIAAAHQRNMAQLVGKVLDVWLDRLCNSCEGRGFNGGYGVPKVMCTKCGGSGSRRQGQLGANQAEQAFCLWILNTMDTKCAASMRQMARKQRTEA